MKFQSETLRTSSPFPATIKSTGREPRFLKVDDKTLNMPVGMNIVSTFSSINYHSRY
jgi:hypothetical protein